MMLPPTKELPNQALNLANLLTPFDVGWSVIG
jgi:hypothetical protein